MKSSIPHPETEISKKSNLIPMNNPMAQVYTYVTVRNNIDIPTILG